MGYALFAIGYVVFYWGLHHPPFKADRYSLWALFGVGTLFKNTSKTNGWPPPGWPGQPVPIQFDALPPEAAPPPPKSAPPKSTPQRVTPAPVQSNRGQKTQSGTGPIPTPRGHPR